MVLLVNNLGATTTMELAIVARRALSLLQSRGLAVERVFAGTFVSSLDAAGMSLSLMKVDDERLRLLDATTSAPAWPRVPAVSTGRLQDRIIASRQVRKEVAPAGPTNAAIQAACHAIIDAEEYLTELDRAAGDGDLGISLARGAHAILKEAAAYSISNWAETFIRIGFTLQKTLGGSSGPLYGVLFSSLGTTLHSGWAEAFVSACDAISVMGGAVAGDRTMLDALAPFAKTFQDARDEKPRAALHLALMAAEEGAAATSRMLPRRGRSTYLGDRALGHPDPGAVAVTVWLRAAINALG